MQNPFTFSHEDVKELGLLMASVKRKDSPAEARHRSCHWLDGAARCSHRWHREEPPGRDFLGSGVKGQQDCVDEATNTTSYLLVLHRNGLIEHHSVERPFAKDSLSKWTHWAALINEKVSGAQFAIDSSGSPNGENPTVQLASSFYVPDGPGPYVPPESGIAESKPIPTKTRPPLALGYTGSVRSELASPSQKMIAVNRLGEILASENDLRDFQVNCLVPTASVGLKAMRVVVPAVTPLVGKPRSPTLAGASFLPAT